MATNSDFVEARLRHVVHPTDFSPAALAAFHHALKLSLGLTADLTIMHMDPQRADPDFEDFPRVRATLSRWGLLPKGATKEQLLQLGLGVSKIRAMEGDPVASMVQLLWRKPADLLVVATHAGDQLVGWLKHPMAPALSRKSRTMSLFVPENCSGFIASETGACRLQRVLIPVAHRPLPQAAIEAACAVAYGLGAHDVSFELFHVGSPDDLPQVLTPWRNGWTWSRACSMGVVVDEILTAAHRQAADLIVMATEWRQGLLDALWGSTTERVLRQVPCPLLAVPVHDSLRLVDRHPAA
ncbi:universal stress protein [Nitrospira moscoviensis]|uniref:Putative Universal stress protein n=1 Tax=Nitrospira moscoviensis TaxID=42253 RepID=A0A0K2GEL7_NITMO|nr:universal stress protein [Nitrospira moscoviensis]ALA59396.1 putative Universal stress protein [Nitrospira moscoviensis]